MTGTQILRLRNVIHSYQKWKLFSWHNPSRLVTKESSEYWEETNWNVPIRLGPYFDVHQALSLALHPNLSSHTEFIFEDDMQFYTCVDITPAIQYNQFWYGQLLVLELDTTSHNVLLSLFLEYVRHHITSHTILLQEKACRHTSWGQCVFTVRTCTTQWWEPLGTFTVWTVHCVGCRVEGGNTGPIPRSSVSFPDHQSHSQITSLIPRPC